MGPGLREGATSFRPAQQIYTGYGNIKAGKDDCRYFCTCLVYDAIDIGTTCCLPWSQKARDHD